ncbi:MAG: hypothetical protein AAFY51_01450 [Pseudomonadota bacterium]
MTILVFVVVKLLRSELAQAIPNATFEVFLYSFPNFAEGLVGFLALAMVLLLAAQRGRLAKRFLTLPWICACAFFGSALYVISQELGLHDLGGHQVYDPYDILFSIAGLIAGLIAFLSLRPARSAP